VERALHPQVDMPDQKIISITPQGAEEFYRWLESQVDEEGHVKFDFFNQYSFLNKVNFFKFLPDDKIITKLKEQLLISAMRLERFNKAREEMIQKKVDVYRIRIIEYGIEVEKLRKEWLLSLLAEKGIKGVAESVGMEG